MNFNLNFLLLILTICQIYYRYKASIFIDSNGEELLLNLLNGSFLPTTH